MPIPMDFTYDNNRYIWAYRDYLIKVVQHQQAI